MSTIQREMRRTIRRRRPLKTRIAEWFSVGALGGIGALFVGGVLSTLPAWVTHVVVCIREGEWGFLIAGALCFPIGIIHGWGIWFGWW